MIIIDIPQDLTEQEEFILTFNNDLDEDDYEEKERKLDIIDKVNEIINEGCIFNNDLDKEIFDDYFFESMSYRQIAKKYNCSKDKVRFIIIDCIKNIKLKLKERNVI